MVEFKVMVDRSDPTAWGTRVSRGASMIEIIMVIIVRQQMPATLLPGEGRNSGCRSSSHISGPSSHIITVTSTNDPAPIFEDGKLKPEIYGIQKIVGQTYADTREHNKELRSRPTTVLEEKDWIGKVG